MEVIVDKPDYIKERIKFETEFFKQAFTFFLLISSATATLLVRVVSNPNITDGLLMGAGAILIGLSLGILRQRYKTIYRFIDLSTI